MQINRVLRRINHGAGFGFTLTFTNLTLTDAHSVEIVLYVNKVLLTLTGNEDATGDFDIIRQGVYNNTRSIIFNITPDQCAQLGTGDLFAEVRVRSGNTLEELRGTFLIAKISVAGNNAGAGCCNPCSPCIEGVTPADVLRIDIGLFTRVAIAEAQGAAVYKVPDAFYTPDYSGLTFAMLKEAAGAYASGKVFMSNIVNTGRVKEVFQDEEYISVEYSYTVFDTNGVYRGYTVAVQSSPGGTSVQSHEYDIQTTEV